jgi:hypothetical protein
MRQLNEYGYIRYKPSYDPVKGSLVYWPAEQQGGKDRPESVRSENFQCESACIEPVRSDKFHSE